MREGVTSRQADKQTSRQHDLCRTSGDWQSRFVERRWRVRTQSLLAGRGSKLVGGLPVGPVCD